MALRRAEPSGPCCVLSTVDLMTGESIVQEQTDGTRHTENLNVWMKIDLQTLRLARNEVLWSASQEWRCFAGLGSRLSLGSLATKALISQTDISFKVGQVRSVRLSDVRDKVRVSPVLKPTEAAQIES